MILCGIMKQVISFTLEKDTITILDKISSAFGKNRSEFMESLVVQFYTPEIAKKIEEILKMQNKIAMETS